MRFLITRQNLHQALSAASASIPSKTTLPVLSNLLVETADGSVRISGTDLDVSIRVSVPAEINEGGAFTVPGKKLQEIARELPDDLVTVSVRGDQIEITCGRAMFKLHGLPAEDFPRLPNVPFDGGWTTTGADLQALIRHTAFAVSTEESRPVLNGVLWELREGEMRMVATNGHRLAKMCIPIPTLETEPAHFVIPPTALQQVQRLLSDAASVSVARADNHLGFRSHQAEIFTRLIEGTYPNYEGVIPKDNDRIAIIGRKALESAVRRVAAVASQQTHRIRLEFSAGRMHLNVLTPDLGEAHDEIEIHYDAEPITIGFNANYLLEVLRYIQTEDVRMSLKAPERAALVEPVEAEGTPAVDYLCLVMPLRLAD
jgi:DNA polymerase III subunit beta